MKPHQPSYALIFIIFSLIIFGLVALATASVVLSQEHFGESYYFLKHQIIYSLSIGLVAFFILQKIYYKYWQKLASPIIIFSIIFLALVFLPGAGYSAGEAKRWIIVGPFSVQPFEFVKLSFIVYLAALLSKRKGGEEETIKQSLIPLFAALGSIALILYFQPNLSAMVILLVIAGLIYFLAGMKIRYLASSGILALLAIFALIKTTSYRMNRLTVYLHPEVDPQGIGYQINQALLAIGSGGLFGLGLGHSIQKWKYLPEPITDSIFAIIAEEMGFFGAGLLTVLFILLGWLGFKIAKNTPDRFSYLLAGGITGWIFIQAAINVTAISGLIPLTGMPLPLISYGGSSLVSILAALGILVNISKYTKT